ncbi:hypothetical protein [Mycobacterium xenopi]|uniref:Uncharacterized protein n=2 Tax=Mycobacterium xenopi TaxID=1789 RepID=A0AAD1GWC7_MYCXE|nr:hypothetical protein [Mycobacterium xenopi]EUA19253.1 hypothetical protein I553_10412 [Mycobacterium xenopi 4042]EUA24558.1 hypothetical protein I552_3422 [Mycobacterium xenopi 3993]MDA3642306.1 hypothetical protein [Mycobacterium xenopi]MDA3660379.1 hypothetical protein [Mycobacterium xenopi]MDA3664936.1 hypothetical protein [Mycobacterium xenopi]
MTEPKLIPIDLTDDEREFMLTVLSEFEGPAGYTPYPIKILGISTSDEFNELLIRLRRAIARKEPLSELDWARAQLLTETCWASSLIGSGLDYGTGGDEKALPLLRSIQRKLCRYPLRSALFPDNGGRPTYAEASTREC